MSANREHMPALDGLRAVAVAAVLFAHFNPKSWSHPLVRLGHVGVILFFVLSGFLISGILLGSRDDIDDGAVRRSACLRIFYVRRALRIFPIYYLTLFAVTLAGYQPVRERLGWLLSYTENVCAVFFGADFMYAEHFWSLCVEEQFYLVWPAII